MQNTFVPTLRPKMYREAKSNMGVQLPVSLAKQLRGISKLTGISMRRIVEIAIRAQVKYMFENYAISNEQIEALFENYEYAAEAAGYEDDF